ncbi:hypothetical protein [Agrococcus sp. ProA11]|uniref:hypothetical protein n=1 Tax=Agrococcus chionoecetis TaxID=3153752 RepID=UPI0032605B67
MTPHRRTSPTPLLLLAAGAALSLSACITPPPLPSGAPADPSSPSVSEEPVETAAPSPTTDPSGAPAEGIPDLVAINTELPPGTLAGWETSLLTADGFEVQPDSTFPAGPTISVVETATGCTFWAFQGRQDSDVSDEAENSAVTLGILSDSSPEEWDPDVFTLEASASQGAEVEMLSIIQDADDGSAEAWFARNFQSGGTTSSIVAECPADAGGVDHIDDVILEHLQINFLVP